MQSWLSCSWCWHTAQFDGSRLASEHRVSTHRYRSPTNQIVATQFKLHDIRMQTSSCSRGPAQVCRFAVGNDNCFNPKIIIPVTLRCIVQKMLIRLQSTLHFRLLEPGPGSLTMDGQACSDAILGNGSASWAHATNPNTATTRRIALKSKNNYSTIRLQEQVSDSYSVNPLR